MTSSGRMATKTVIVGDGATGKTTLLATATTGEFASMLEYEGPKFETKIRVGGKERLLDLFDTCGHDENLRQRLSLYPETDIFMITFSIVSPYSFEHVRSKWYPELSRHAPSVPIILVGTKVDLREDQDALERLGNRKLAPITFSQGTEMKKEINAVAYVECSSLDGSGLGQLLQVVLDYTPSSKKELLKEESLVMEKKSKKNVIVLKKDGRPHHNNSTGVAKCSCSLL